MTKGLNKQAAVNVLAGRFHIPCRELFICLLVIFTGLASKELFGLKYSFPLGNTGDMVVEEKINNPTQFRNTTITPFYFASHTVPDVLTAPGKINSSSLMSDKNDWLNVPHLFTCHNATSAPHGLPGRNTKLVFVHIFKTAGSTLRGLFKRYAEKCHAGWQLTIRCTGVNETSVLPESVMSGYTEYTSWWNFGNNQPCVPKSGVNRKGKKLNISSSFNSDFLEENIDILGGHLELGSADYTWTKFEDVRYVAFFREAVSMFVSGEMYNKQLTLEQHLKAIQDTVESNLAQGIYNSRYSSYLLTPFQKAALKRQQRKLSPQERAALIQSNIMNYRIICGLTERMVESLEILHHLIDSDNAARSIFESWGMPNKDGNLVNNLKHFNTMAQREGVSTKTVIEELKKNETFYKLLTEYVKYEQQVTDFATSVHIQQYASIKKGLISKQ